MSVHIEAKLGEIAEKILLPGDPLRAKYIAETFLTDVFCYNNVRGMLGFTGFYNGKRVSVQGTGMGMPSMSIYANELMAEYGVKNLIRVGTCGSIREDLKLKETVIALSASTDSSMNKDRFGSISFAPSANFELLNLAYNNAVINEIPVKIGNVYTSDKFYDDALMQKINLLASYNTLAVDMETCELYTLAAKFGAKALTIMTVSDNIITKEATTAAEREKTFNDMIKIALDVI